MEPDGYTANNDVIDGGASPLEDLWEGYGKPLVDFNTDVECNYGADSVAEQVLLAFDIPYDASSTSFSYGNLEDMDIKRMDAATALNMSLMEEAFLGSHSHFIEPIVNEEGKVEFVVIGGNTVSITDVYYEIQTSHYRSEPSAVMVTGGRPVPELLPIEWKPIWFGEEDNQGSIYAAGSMLSNCMETNWKSYANIVFNNPNLDSSYDDGIDNLYEITEPFDRIAGYAVYVEPPNSTTKKTTIGYTTETEIPLLIAEKSGDICNIGTLQKLPVIETGEDPNCWEGMTGGDASYEDGVPVEIPSHFRFENKRGTTVDKFINISGVFVIGKEIEALYARPKDLEKALQRANDTNSDVWVFVEKTRRSTFKLEETKHYTVAYQDLDGDTFQEVSIVFAKETRPNDDVTYGNGQEGSGQVYRLDPFCKLAEELGDELGEEKRATILPMNKTMGILVEEIWVTARMETHAITVYDPNGRDSRALDIAINLKYYLGALIIREMPNPIGFKSSTTSEKIDLEPSERDNDPTTSQDFTNTPYELAMDEMQGSGMTVSYSFLDGGGAGTAEAAYNTAQDQCLDAAIVLYNMINDDVTETVYTCGPDSKPKLGNAGPAGGIINGIKYQYNDQGSYTISVTEGPTIVGNLVQADGGPSQKMAEDHGARGTVIQARGDNLHFKVRIDGFGERWAVNMCHSIIREGDVVQCSIHNLPVEA